MILGAGRGWEKSELILKKKKFYPTSLHLEGSILRMERHEFLILFKELVRTASLINMRGHIMIFAHVTPAT